MKVGIATAAVYYIKEQNVWRSSNESVETLERLKGVCKPYVQEMTSQIPVEVLIILSSNDYFITYWFLFQFPALPETDRVSSLAKESWNRGVLVTFNFIANLPEKVTEWSLKGIEALQHPEMKNIISSFSEENKEK